jgi:hypothetical protein
MPMTEIRTCAKFFTSYEHPVPVVAESVPAITSEAIQIRIGSAFGGVRPSPTPIMGDFNFDLVKESSLIKNLNVVNDVTRTLEEAIEELASLSSEESFHRDVEIADPDDENEDTIFERIISQFASKRGTTIEQALASITLLEITNFLKNILQAVIVVAHFKSNQFFVLQPINVSLKKPILILAQTGVGQYATSAILPADAEVVDVDDDILVQDVPTRQAQPSNQRESPLTVLPVVVAPKQPADQLQKNIIIRVTDAEVTKLLHIVKLHLVNAKKKNIVWDAVLKSWEDFVSSDENRNAAVPLRYARDEKQLHSIFQNRKVYSFTSVAEFETWHEAFKKTASAARVRSPPHTQAAPAAKALDEDEQPPRSKQRTEEKGSAGNSAVQPKEIVQDRLDHDLAMQLQEQILEETGPERVQRDLCLAASSTHWKASAENKEEELGSLRPGKLIFVLVIHRALVRTVQSHGAQAFVWSFRDSEHSARSTAELDGARQAAEGNKALLWLLRFSSHFIAAAFRRATSAAEENTVQWWDSMLIRKKHYQTSRLDALSAVVSPDMVGLGYSKFSFNRLKSDEQQEGSNDCGVYSLQNLFNFIGVDVQVSREWLRQFTE